MSLIVIMAALLLVTPPAVPAFIVASATAGLVWVLSPDEVLPRLLTIVPLIAIWPCVRNYRTCLGLMLDGARPALIQGPRAASASIPAANERNSSGGQPPSGNSSPESPLDTKPSPPNISEAVSAPIEDRNSVGASPPESKSSTLTITEPKPPIVTEREVTTNVAPLRAQPSLQVGLDPFDHRATEMVNEATGRARWQLVLGGGSGLAALVFLVSVGATIGRSPVLGADTSDRLAPVVVAFLPFLLCFGCLLLAAAFLLRQYRASLDDARHFERSQRLRESQRAAINAAQALESPTEQAKKVIEILGWGEAKTGGDGPPVAPQAS
jgi:hypothetical protein